MCRMVLFVFLFCLVGKLAAQTLQPECCTYLGGSDDDRVHGMTIDKSGSVYLTAPIRSTDFPITKGAVQKNATGVYVARIGAACDSLLLSTWIGMPGGANYAHNIAVDDNGFIYVYGNSTNADFPTTPGAFDRTFHGPADASHGDVYVMKLSPAGDKIVWSTFIGGSGMDLSGAILLDREGNAILTGCTSSPDFPVTPGAYDTSFNGGEGDGRDDVFIAKLSADGADLLFCTYLGGSKTEPGAGITMDINGDIYLYGTTSSTDFPVTENAYLSAYQGGSGQHGQGDAFLAKLSADGSRLDYSTFIGTSGDETVSSVVIGPDGQLFLAGYTNSPDFPTTSGVLSAHHAGGNDGFLMKFSPDLKQLLTSTFIGGSGEDAHLVLRYAFDKLLVCGETESTDFPVTDNALDASFNGNSDRFITLIEPDMGKMTYSTFWGGSGYDSGAMCVDNDYLYLAGTTTSRDLPVTDGVYDTSYNGGGSMRWGGDAYVVKFRVK